MPDLAMMGLLSWLLMGLLAGALARFLMPGDDSMGCFMTSLIGIIGAFVGGFIATLLGFGGFRAFDLYSLIVATLGAVVLLMLARLFRGSRR
jgi:uncharacterized membrane protein YeaQ/YmgE (transglycosylase-associated protein family)